jgi:hypothetical protein
LLARGFGGNEAITEKAVRSGMKSYETAGTVADHGALQLAGLPFAPGTRVEVSISPKEATPTSSKQTAYDELDEVYKACRNLHWDAHGAEPVKLETREHARRFLEALPPEYPLPSVGAEPDGHVTLEWYRATNWLLSVSVSPEGMLYWAALLGDENPRGSCRFDGEVPETVLYWIRRVGAQ